jgi:outer membrane immunogenic protein
MKVGTNFCAFVISVCLLNMPAKALDMPVAPTFNWSAWYVGVQGGYSFASADAFIPVQFASVAIDDMHGVFGGIYFGRNWKVDSLWVLGFEVDANISSASAFADMGNPILSADVHHFGSVRGRIGAVKDRTLIYLTGGWAWADVEHGQVFGGAFGVDRKFQFGWTAGAGLEYEFTSRVIGRIEYRYYNFGNRAYNLSPTFISRTVELDINTVSLGVAYRW